MRFQWSPTVLDPALVVDWAATLNGLMEVVRAWIKPML